MDTLIIALAALLASGLTLFSGFGLGTLLMPVVAIFFPLDIAIGITAVVHFANNLFKLGLVGWQAERDVVLRFGVPAVLAALLGAVLLGQLGSLAPVLSYTFASKALAVMPVKLVIGIVIIAFVILEVSPRFAAMSFERRYLPLGGALSGFFGGLSGHQGALRSMFLLKTGLAKEQFIATGVVLAVLVDMTRLSIYGWEVHAAPPNVDWWLVGIATLAAFAGAYLGARLVKKITLRSIQMIVSVLLVVVALGMMSGFL